MSEKNFSEAVASNSVTNIESNYTSTVKMHAQHNWLCSRKKPFNGFFLLSFAFLIFAFVTTSEALARVAQETTYTSADENVYKYKWHIGELAQKWTEWEVNGEKQIDYKGWVEPGPGILPNNPKDPVEPELPFIYARLSLAGEGLLHYELILKDYEENEGDIFTEIIDASSGEQVDRLTFQREAFIAVHNLPKNTLYFIVSANHTGVIHRIAFILNENQIYIDTEYIDTE